MSSNITPYIFSRDCKKHIEWLRSVFDIEVGEMHFFKEEPERVMHTCMSFRDGGKVMMSDYLPGEAEKCSSDRGFAVSLTFTEGNGEKYWKKAVENGGLVKMEYAVQYWGSYFGSFVDPFGFMWFVVEEIPGDKVSNGAKEPNTNQ